MVKLSQLVLLDADKNGVNYCIKNILMGAAIAQWIRLCLRSCHPEFESQPHYLCYLS